MKRHLWIPLVLLAALAYADVAPKSLQSVLQGGTRTLTPSNATDAVTINNGVLGRFPLHSTARLIPYASGTVAGVIKVGSGLAMNNGVLNNTGISGVASFNGRGGAVKPGFSDYSASMIKGIAPVAKTGNYADLSGKPTIPAAQVNSDWNASTGAAQILNKPTIPTALSQLTQSSTSRTVTDAEKATWNAQSNSVSSVNGQTGTVVLGALDVGADALGAATSVQENLDALEAALSAQVKTDDLITKGPVVDVRAFGAQCDGTTDNTAALEAANVYLDSVGGGKMTFPAGTCVASSLKIRNKVIYEGVGEATVLKLKSGTNANFITKNSNLVQAWAIRNMTLDGNKSGNTAGSILVVDHADDGVGLTGDNDVRARLENLWIKDAKESGIQFTGAGTGSGGNYYNVRNMTIDNIQIRTCEKYGIDASRLTDSKIANIVISGCKLGGGKFVNCGNLQLLNTKGFYNGVDDPNAYEAGLFFQDTRRVVITNHEAQEEYSHGIKIVRGQNFSLNGILLDSNGYPAGASRCGLYIYNSTNILGNVTVDSFHSTDAVPYLQDTGVKIIADAYSSEKIDIRLGAQNQTTQYAVVYQNGGTLAKSLININGKPEFKTDASAYKAAFSETGNRVLDEAAFHSGNDALARVDVYPLGGNGNAFMDFFRATNTTGIPQMRVFRGDNTATVDHMLQGGLRNAELCRNGGGWNTGHLVLGGHHVFYAAAKPTSGTWSVGDRALNSAPSTGQPKGWIYTSGGWVVEEDLANISGGTW